MTDKILLPWPAALTMSVGDALKKRRTVRDCSDRSLPDSMLSALLWASAGITDADGRRTVPSTLDLRAVSVWVVREDGAWRYDAQTNTLERTSDVDCRLPISSNTSGGRPSPSSSWRIMSVPRPRGQRPSTSTQAPGGRRSSLQRLRSACRVASVLRSITRSSPGA